MPNDHPIQLLIATKIKALIFWSMVIITEDTHLIQKAFKRKYDPVRFWKYVTKTTSNRRFSLPHFPSILNYRVLNSSLRPPINPNFLSRYSHLLYLNLYMCIVSFFNCSCKSMKQIVNSRHCQVSAYFLSEYKFKVKLSQFSACQESQIQPLVVIANGLLWSSAFFIINHPVASWKSLANTLLIK